MKLFAKFTGVKSISEVSEFVVFTYVLVCNMSTNKDLATFI